MVTIFVKNWNSIENSVSKIKRLSRKTRVVNIVSSFSTHDHWSIARVALKIPAKLLHATSVS